MDTVTGEVFEARLTPAFADVEGWLATLPGPVAVAYEAGPTGFGLCRHLRGRGVRCEVLAPSRLLRPSGDRVKTDARDAAHLSKLLRLDEYTPVEVPSADREMARDLVRARDDARGDVMAARHRLSKLLLRHGIVYSQGRAWTQAHEVWLRAQRFDSPALQDAFDVALIAVGDATGRRDRLDAVSARMAEDCEFTALIHRLECLRGVSTLTGFALAVEIGDWTRFTGATIGSFVGLVPSERSSGGSRSQGAITRTGNAHARRLLIEAAWHHRTRYLPSKALRARWAQSTPAAVERGDAANQRLNHRWNAFTARRKRPTIANTAIARELAGWCWSLAVMDD